MLEEVGSVVELKGKGVAVVLCEKSSFCENCASTRNCQVGTDNRSMLVEAHNQLGAAVGDRVKVATSSKTFLQSSFILYIVPLLFLIAGAVSGQVVGTMLEQGPDPNLLSAILGVAFLAGSFVLIRVGSRAIPKEITMPRVIEILGEE
jgi:sigma-E factor negative regulatory protein RseC